jgi:putative peptidoglycan lipid II flippase
MPDNDPTTEKKSIVHVLEGFLGGTCTYMCSVLPELAKHHDVTLICSLNRSCPEAATSLSVLRGQGIKVHIIRMQRQINPFHDILSLFRIRKILSKHRFDIVHTHCSKAGALGRIAAFLAGVKTVFHTPHCFAFLRCKGRFRRYVYLTLERMLAKLTNKVIAVSQSEKEVAVKYRIVSADRCLVVSNGLAADSDPLYASDETEVSRIKARLGLDPSKRVVSTVCRLIDYKGVARFLEAARLSRAANVTFTVAGDGEQKSVLEDIVGRYNLSDKVKLLGHIQGIQDIYAISDAVVLCSDAEGQPYTLLEAMRAKCPIIATAVTGNMDLVIDGVTGLLAQPEAASIAQAIDGLLADGSAAAPRVTAAYLRSSQEHALDKQVADLMDIYAGRAAPPALKTPQVSARPVNQHSETPTLDKAVLALSVIAICTKVFGFAEKFIIAHFFGTGDTADVYFATMGIVLSIVYLVKELIYPSLLPVFADSLRHGPFRSGGLFRQTFFSAGAVVMLVTLAMAVFSGPICKAMVPGFTGSKSIMTSRLLRILTPALLFLSLGMVTSTVLNARKRFLAAAWPDAALKLFTAIGLVCLIPAIGISALAVAVGIGSLCSLLIHMYYIPERSFLIRHPYKDSTAFRKVLFLMAPLAVGVVFSHISGLVDNVLASTLPSGHLSYLGYSKKLIDAILLIGPVALVTVAYSQLAHLASARQHENVARLAANVFRLLLYVSVPMACLLIALRLPIIRCLFERGQFGAESTYSTAQAFMIYAIGLATFAIENLVVCAFFALSDTKTPVRMGILCVVVDIVLAVLLLRPLGYLGIAGAFVLSKTMKIVILTLKLNNRLAMFARKEILIFAAKLMPFPVIAFREFS